MLVCYHSTTCYDPQITSIHTHTCTLTFTPNPPRQALHIHQHTPHARHTEETHSGTQHGLEVHTHRHTIATFSYHHCSNPSRLLSHSPRLGSVQFGLHSALPIPVAQPFTIQLAVINYHHHRYYHDFKGPIKAVPSGRTFTWDKDFILMFSRTNNSKQQR